MTSVFRAVAVLGLTVTLRDAGGNNRNATTDNTGLYRFEVEPGTYTVTPYYPGLSFAPTTRTGVVNESNVDEVNFIAQVGRG